MRFLNCDKVLCLAAHPDDVEYGMLGSIMKYTDTKFDILVLSEGGNFDESTSVDRHKECESIWEEIDNFKILAKILGNPLIYPLFFLIYECLALPLYIKGKYFNR